MSLRLASRLSSRRPHHAHPYYAGTSARSSSCQETKTQYYGSLRVGGSDEAPPPDRNILVLVEFQDLTIKSVALFDPPSSPTLRELKNKRFSCGHNSAHPHQLGSKHWPFAFGPNGILTSTRIGWKSAIKTWMEIRSR